MFSLTALNWLTICSKENYGAYDTTIPLSQNIPRSITLSRTPFSSNCHVKGYADLAAAWKDMQCFFKSFSEIES